MATVQADQLAAFFAAVGKRTKPDLDVVTRRDILERMHLCSSEPEAVAYAEVDAGGVPAMWCIPAGCDDGTVVMWCHAGGTVVFSMHSDRKIAGHLAKAAGTRALVLDFRHAETAPAPNGACRYAVKDSFARLDLAADGLTVLFEAEWIARTPVPAAPTGPGLSWELVTDALELGRWETAWAQGDSSAVPLFRPELLADPRCAILACRRDGDLIAGTIAYSAAGVTGISNLFGTGPPGGQLWASALQAVAAFRPHLPIVGYEHGTALTAARHAGCQTLGPLRIWTRNPAP